MSRVPALQLTALPELLDLGTTVQAHQLDRAGLGLISDSALAQALRDGLRCHLVIGAENQLVAAVPHQ